MRTTTITPGEERYPAALYLGRVGENLTRQIVFDCSALAEECGAGVAEIVAMTPEGTKYAPANVTQEGSVVTWLISEADVGTAGRGRAELSWIVGDGVAKTITWQTLIRASLTGTEGEEPPDVYKDWVDKITRVGTQAGIDAQSAEESAQSAEESAQAAADSAEGAAGSANSAGESAGAAEQSAQRAETAAQTATTQAERTKELVDGAVDTIQQATTEGVTEVETSGATQSQRLATQGAAIVEEAAEQAERAKASEEAAQRSAEDAAESAQTATEQAATATDKAAEAAQSAEAAQQAQAAAETAQGKAEDAQAAAEEAARQAAQSAETAGETALGAYVCKTAEGAAVSFDDGAEDVPLKSCVVQIEPAQEGSGDPSPDNVRPIKGWTGCTLSHSGEDTSAPTTYPINWEAEAGTVYGGTLDVLSGVLTVDRAGTVYDGSSDEAWAKYNQGSASAFAMKITVANMKKANPADEIVVASNELKAVAPNATWGNYDSFISTQANSETLAAGINTITTVADWRTYLASNPLQVLCKLATPITYTLTPTEIKSLLGDNNIWADTGDVSVEYRADPTILYNKLTNAIISTGGNV